MLLDCHKCRTPSLDPCHPCPNCGQLIDVSLWTTAEHVKLNEHGLFIVDGSLQIDALPLGSSSPVGKSFFSPDIDLASSIRYVFASGHALTPVDSYGHRSPSLFWYFGHTTGSGALGGTPTCFQGIRIVKPESPTHIHLFPDNPRSVVDHSLTCRNCGKVFPIDSLPENCDQCNYRILW